VKKNLIIILVLLVNIPIAFIIVKIFSIQNIALFDSIKVLNNITIYEIIIWGIVSLIEYVIYKYLEYRRLQGEKWASELNQALKEMKERLKNNN